MSRRVEQRQVFRLPWRVIRAGLVRVVGVGCLFLVELTLARVFGAEDYGVFAYVISWLAILAVLGRFGMDGAALRFAAAYRAEAAWSRLRAFLRESLAIILIASSLVGLATWFTTATVMSGKDQLQRAFAVGCLVLPWMALSSWATNLLLAAGQTERAIALDKIVRSIIMVLLLMVLALWGPPQPNGEVALLIFGASTMMSLALGGFWIWRSYPREVFRAPSRPGKREWLRVAVALVIVANLQLIIARTDVVMVGALLDPTQAGIYRASARVSDLAVFGLTSVGIVVGPRISQLHRLRDVSGLRTLLRGAWRLSVGLTIPLGLGLAVLSKEALALFGDDFSSGRMPLLILIGGQVFNGLCGPVGMILTMTGRHVSLAWILGGAAVLNVAPNAMLIPAHGMSGAAMATVAATVFWNLGSWGWVAWRGMGSGALPPADEVKPP